MRSKTVWKLTSVSSPLFLIVVFSLVLIPNQVSAQPTAPCEALPTLEGKTAQQLRLVGQEAVIECLTDKVAVFGFEEPKSKFGWIAMDAFANQTILLLILSPLVWGRREPKLQVGDMILVP